MRSPAEIIRLDRTVPGQPADSRQIAAHVVPQATGGVSRLRQLAVIVDRLTAEHRETKEPDHGSEARRA
jgi:hypothetical protein